MFYCSYDGDVDTPLEEMRYRKFMDMVTTRSSIHPEKLPPTERASFFHALRVHLQVCQWKYLDQHILSVGEWGWTVRNGTFASVKTDIDPAPEWLLNYVRCQCKQTSKNPCGTQTCSCRKNGLSCVQVCSGCHGESCNNQSESQGNSDSDSDEDCDFDRNIFDIFN